MKFNWGTGIALFYGVFVMVMLGLVWKSKQYDLNMVAPDYYAQDIAYQKHYDKLRNSQYLPENVKINYVSTAHIVEVRFPENLGKIDGEITFFRPSDSNKDFKVPIKPDASSVFIIPVKDKLDGLWKVQIDWKAENGVAYFTEQSLNL